MKLKYSLASIIIKAFYKIEFNWSTDLREIICDFENQNIKHAFLKIHNRNSYQEIREKLLRNLLNE